MTAPGRQGKPSAQVDGQDELLAGDQVDKLRTDSAGPVELATRATVDAAQLHELDGAAAALAVELGRAVDIGNRRRDPYAVAAAARELREQLIRLRLDPTSREGSTGDDPFDAWLRANSGATDDAAAGAG